MADVITATGSIITMTTDSKHCVATVHQPTGTETPVNPGENLPTHPAGTYTLKVRDLTLANFTVKIAGDNPSLTEPHYFEHAGVQRVWIDYEARDGFVV
jgi:hypothetical protein